MAEQAFHVYWKWSVIRRKISGHMRLTWIILHYLTTCPSFFDPSVILHAHWGYVMYGKGNETLLIDYCVSNRAILVA
jgi:hypothetical protein